MKRTLKLLALALAVTLLATVPSAYGKYKENFAFGLGANGGAGIGLNNASANPANANANGQLGMEIVYSANHLFDYEYVSGSAVDNQQNQGLQRTMEIKRAGWYAFIIRGGDGGRARITTDGQNDAGSFGGAGGMVMGYLNLNAGTTLYIEVASAGAVYQRANTRPRAHLGGGQNSARGGLGGGATVLSTESIRGVTAVTDPLVPSIIAVAGGGGGGGGNNAAANDRSGGNAGGAGGVNATSAGQNSNPILNGFQVANPEPGHNAANSGLAGTAVYNSGGVKGLVSTGYQAGYQVPGQTNAGAKNTARWGTNVPAGGGGGVTGGGAAGTGGTGNGNNGGNAAGGIFLQGGNCATSSGASNGGGGGSGWFGGSGGCGSNATHGGGGGSSFVRSDVRPLTNEMRASDYFKSFIWLHRYAQISDTAPTAYNANIDSQFTPSDTVPETFTGTVPNSVLRYYQLGNTTPRVMKAGNNISGILELQKKLMFSVNTNGTTTVNTDTMFRMQGWSGFAFIKYLGPIDPADVFSAGWQGHGSWPF